MTVTEFFSYLLDRDATRDLALELVEICTVRESVSQATADSNLVPA
jgi:hypothetical protein